MTDIHDFFPGLKQCTYLNTANNALGNTRAQAAYREVLDKWLDGSFNFMDSEARGEKLRNEFASLINANTSEIAMCSFLSSASGAIAEQMEATLKDNIVLADYEFASNFYPWMLLENKGYEIRKVKTTNGKFNMEDMEAAMDNNTALVALSSVQSSTGFRANLKSISDMCKKYDSLLFVDASQSMGCYPIDVKELEIDFLASVNYKYLLGARGIAYLYINQKHLSKIRPITAGWRAGKEPMKSFYGPSMQLSENASKMDTSLAWFAANADLATFEMMKEIGLDKIYSINQELRNYFANTLRENNISFNDYGDLHISNAITIPVKDAESLKATLKENNIICSVRTGNLRVSVHFYNTKAHIDQLVGVLKSNL